MSVAIRPATAADKDFLITAIVEAEKSGTDIISYCTIFGIAEQQLRQLLANVLEEEVPGQELCVDSFMVAEEDGQPMAALAAWVEGFEGISSGLLKSNMLVYYIGAEEMLLALPQIEQVAKVNIERQSGALQIESVYVAPPHRGKGISAQLIDAQEKRWRNRGFDFDMVQVMLMGNNAAAKKAYEKMGFSLHESKTSQSPEINRLLPGDTKISMQRKTN